MPIIKPFGIIGVPKRGSGPLVKPAPGSVIATQHPLAQGLVGCWLFRQAGTSYRDELGRNYLNSVSAHTKTPYGIYSPSAHANYRLAGPAAGTAGFNTVAQTCTAIYYPIASPDSNATIMATAWYANGPGWKVEHATTPTANIRSIIISSGTPGTFAASFTPQSRSVLSIRVTAATTALFENGVSKTSANTPGDYAAPANPLTFLGSPQPGGTVGGIEMGCLHNRSLNPSEIARLHAEPYCFFWTPAARTIFLPMEAGGSAIISVRRHLKFVKRYSSFMMP